MNWKNFLIGLLIANATGALDQLALTYANKDTDSTGTDDAIATWLFAVSAGLKQIQAGQLPDAVPAPKA